MDSFDGTGQVAAVQPHEHFTPYSARFADQSGLPLLMEYGRPAPAHDTPVRRLQLVAKRVFDIFFSLAALVGLSALFLIVAILIKVTSRGPVLFSQPREGRNGKLFSAYKFRSMHHEKCDVSGIRQTANNDPRVTFIGQYLRRYNIDELPQLFNVLKGDMSIVGPRPHVKGMIAGDMLYTELVPYYRDRLAMVPGITGWAQANGFRGPTISPQLAQARIDHDMAYIQHFSFWLDIKIILMTIRRELISGNGN